MTADQEIAVTVMRQRRSGARMGDRVVMKITDRAAREVILPEVGEAGGDLNRVSKQFTDRRDAPIDWVFWSE